MKAINKQQFLCVDDDGDTMICVHPKGQCKASVCSKLGVEHFCGGCTNLIYKLGEEK